MNNYGFITQFDVIDCDAKTTIRYLHEEFGIEHFQFYDCMERYEQPLPNKFKWKDPIGRTIRRRIIESYLDEINRLGLSSWFYTGIYTVSPNYEIPGLNNALFTKKEDKFIQDWTCIVKDNPTYTIINPACKEWKEFYPNELKKALDIGFTGIHFDQYGGLNDKYDYIYTPKEWTFDNNEEMFKKIDKRLLFKDFFQHLKQNHPEIKFTFNAVDGYGYEETKDFVEFPYIECWSDFYIKEYCNKLQGEYFILPTYPKEKNVFKFDEFNNNRNLINKHGGALLYAGDEGKILINCYFPSAVDIIDL
ncbi:glycoside hydrolase family 66 protein [Nanoarchaeota archaeon]